MGIPMPTLSVIVITKNEAHNIKACLESVSFADQIIVYDCGSQDDTVAICKSYTEHVVETDWPGDGPQKNRALNDATGDWVLCLDADERVTPDLAQEIQTKIGSHQANGFIIPFQSTYCGKAIKYGDWHGEKHLRLFKRAKGGFSDHVVHCHTTVEGNIEQMKHKIIHHPFQNLDAMLHKLNDYSTGSALRKFKQGKKASLWTAVSHGLWTFIRGYVLKRGCLDGKEGFMLAMSNAQGTYYRYLKLMLLTKQGSNDDTTCHTHVSPSS